MTPIERLAEQVGFQSSYINSFNEQVYATNESRLALLKAMGYQVDNEQQIEACIDELTNEPWLRLLPATQIIKVEDDVYSIMVTTSSDQTPINFKWRIKTEFGEQFSGSINLALLDVVDEKNHNSFFIVLYSIFSFFVERCINAFFILSFYSLFLFSLFIL